MPSSQPEFTTALAVNLLAIGNITEFNAYRARGKTVSLQGQKLPNANLDCANFSGMMLAQTVLTKANLAGCNFTGADLRGADLTKVTCSPTTVFRDCDLRCANLTHANLTNVNLDGAKFSFLERGETGAILHNTDMEDGSLVGADFRGAQFNPATSFEGANLTRAVLAQCDLTGVRMRKAVLCYATLSGATLKGTKLENADLFAAHMDAAECAGAQLASATLVEADLRGADLRHANLSNANLTRALMSAVRMNKSTSLDDANVEECEIDRFSLETLGDTFGGLTQADRMVMKIHDGVAELRYQYSGFLSYIHLIALAAFVFPYLWFIGSLWVHARFGEYSEIDSITIFEAMFRFIYSGGVRWQDGWHLNPILFVTFCFALGYNILRFVLLLKTKALELRQQASGLPVKFSLAGTGWGKTNQIAKVFFWVNLAVVLWHTCHFLMQRVPLPD